MDIEIWFETDRKIAGLDAWHCALYSGETGSHGAYGSTPEQALDRALFALRDDGFIDAWKAVKASL